MHNNQMNVTFCCERARERAGHTSIRNRVSCGFNFNDWPRKERGGRRAHGMAAETSKASETVQLGVPDTVLVVLIESLEQTK